MADKNVEEKTIVEDLVVTKYKLAGEIVNRVLKQVIEKCQPSKSVREICEFGDSLILEETNKVFKKEKELKKGIAFPTCISVNNCICHFSPIPNDPDVILQDGDLVKIDLGAHIDGFIAVVAHSLILGASAENKAEGKKADVILAAHYASQAALRLLKPGNETYAVTDAVQKICESFKCKPIEGMLSHQLKQFTIDGEKTIIQNPNDAQKKEHEKYEFQTYEVYAMDVLVSTGEGVSREMDSRTSIYKKTEEVYQLKLKASRMFFSEAVNKYGSMPFNIRGFEDENKARMGVVECLNHKLVEPFQVLYEKTGESVAHFKFTVLLMPNGTHKITGLPFDLNYYKTEYQITDPELQALLSTTANPKSAKKKKKKAEKIDASQSMPIEVEGKV
ncbi:Proliferation-associated protein 2G4 [Polyplax serrata]|uniref:Proliferation-associated protein 2G4 n=1 Tax=Polyplax serrata TaxID=468196 RepID=A0AAN8SCS9_POLSC